jgi:energy-coupling factor transporter ATP-binding protein EcfA2
MGEMETGAVLFRLSWGSRVLLCGLVSLLAYPSNRVAAQHSSEIATIKSVEPNSADPGAVVAITIETSSGNPIVPTLNLTKVYFGDQLGEVTGASKNLVQARVPKFESGGVKNIQIGGDVVTSAPWRTFQVTLPAQPTQIPNWLLITFSALIVSCLIGGILLVRHRALEREARLREELDRVRYSFDRHVTTQPAPSPPGDAIQHSSSEQPSTNTSSAMSDHADQPARQSVVPQVPADLIQACSSGNCVLFAGSGLSAQAGLPTWTEILARFLKELQEKDGAASWSSLHEQLVRGEVSAVVDLLVARSKIKELIALLLSVYGSRKAIPNVITELLTAIPFSGAMTTNFDHVLETASEQREPDVVALRARTDFTGLLRSRRFFILKLHGDVDDPGSVVVGTDQFGQALDETPNLRAFIGSLFSSQTIFFVGASISGIEWFLTSTRIKRSSSTRHFALVADQPNFEVTAERFRARFNIELIRFVPTPGFPEVAAFLQELCNEVRAVPLRESEAQSKVAPSRIDSVALKNIGPFDAAEFKFRESWTVLLGNNGCGKSTVLRAIALVLSGDDEEAKKAGQSLLKSGATEPGSIEITVGSITYQTKLLIQENRVVVRADQIPPLKAGTLVAMGFPAVRGIASGKVEPKKLEIVRFPLVDDVIPLLRGGLDSRAANVRQWIVNTYVRSRDSNLPEQQRRRYARMLNSFFQVVDDMVPGFNLQFHSCNSETFEILLETSDGPLPMDYVSQGMQSTIGWVGVLLQRMYDIYANSDRPEKEHALLLIDEIDSHLHPEWQRILMPQIKKHFPGLQVIASTHSPLLVGNVKAGELIKFTRGPDSIEVEHIAQSFGGYRADQILTGKAFGLDSSRSPEWGEKRDRYAILLGKQGRSKEEDDELGALEGELSDTPRSQETELGRRGADLVDQAVRQQLSNMQLSEEDKQKLAAESKLYLTKVMAR